MKVIVGKINGNSIESINEEIKDMAKKVELIIVVGEKKSVDTNNIYNISLKECGNAMLAETMDDLYLNYIKRFKTVGIIPDAFTNKNQMLHQ